MSRIDDTFAALKAEGRKGFVAYLTAGDPDLDTTLELVLEFERRGVDIVELGIPFSDPLADGAANQASAQRALRHGVSLADVIGLVSRIREKSEIPIVFFTYYNPVHRFGIERFVDASSAAGTDGALVLDLPPEEAGDYRRLMADRGLDTIFLITPTSREARIRLIAECSTGFVYCVSRTGVTGESDRLSDALKPMVERIRAHTDKPLAVGFGISQPEQAAEVAATADAVVVGSAINRRIAENDGNADLVDEVGAFVETLVRPLRLHL